ncbi:MAG TPA: DUF4429 domain-containing protein [Pseudonocardiaceae bacterium]
MDLAFELRGRAATWRFETDGIRIRYQPGMMGPKLFKHLRERFVPHEALAGVLLQDRGRRPVLWLRLRQGACPLLAVAAGQLPEAADPYRLVLRPEDRERAALRAQELQDRIALNPDAERPAERFLLSAPHVPIVCRGMDGEAHFDGRTISFRWGMMASRAKRRAGDRSYSLAEVDGVEWTPPLMSSNGVGYLRLRLVGGGEGPSKPADDPSCMQLGMGQGDPMLAVLFGAAVLAALADRPAPPAELPAAEGTPRALPPGTLLAAAEEVAAAIRKLGELRDAGLLSEEEFQAKKAELLDRL